MNTETRVLIVDDKEENIYYLQALLSAHGYVVETARHGAEALVKARQSRPHLVVSDLLMPVMDGYTLLRHWKADARLNDVPFIVYTATYTEAEDERLALNLGADAFILKPAEPDDFLSRIGAAQANRRTPTPEPPRHPSGDEHALLKVYSETLIRKLEEKTLQLEEANRVLQRDIENRRLAEEQLRESEERFRATFEQAAVGIAHVDPAGRFIRVNDKLCEITGYRRDELLAMTFADLSTGDERERGEAARHAMLAGERSTYTTEKRYLHKSGTAFWATLVTTLLRDLQNQPKYFISVIADITERKQLEDQLLRSQRLESLGTLAGGIAHDLNNLLVPIVMGVGLLKQHVTTAPAVGIIEAIEQSAKRGTDLVKQVLSFARGADGARVVVHLGHIVREVETIVRTTFPKNIVCRTDVPQDTALVTGDPTQLNQVLLNLCVNARDAMPDGGKLLLSTRNIEVDEPFAAMHRAARAGRYVLLTVSDTGSGMPPEILDRIFEPFFTTKEPGKGTGLGLSTALGIVRGHGGFVDVVSEPCRGSTFKIYLPALLEQTAADEAPPLPEKLPRGNGELLLLVEDEASILDITQQTLESFGYRVVAAEDGAQAIGLYALHRDHVVAVLTDMMMPAMDGPALAAALRRINPRLPIIGASGLNAESYVARASAAGVKDFLAKPYSAEALLTMIKSVIERETKPRASRPPFA